MIGATPDPCAGRPMATAAQARAACLAQGSPRDACDEMIRNKSLADGTFCDGELVIDASGRRCVPDCTLQRKLAQELANLPPQRTPAQTVAIAAAGAAIIAAAVYWYTR